MYSLVKSPFAPSVSTISQKSLRGFEEGIFASQNSQIAESVVKQKGLSRCLQGRKIKVQCTAQRGKTMVCTIYYVTYDIREGTKWTKMYRRT
jgi:hypothetical protein